MNWLHPLVAQPVSAAIGWTVLHSLWQGAILASFLGFVLACTRSPRIRYAASLITVLLLFVAAAVTFIRLLPDARIGELGSFRTTLPAWRNWPISNGRGGLWSELSILVPWVGPGWFFGVCLFYLRQAAGWTSTRSLRRRGICAAPQSWQVRVSSLGRELRISKSVKLLESVLADTPIVLGHFRPVILIPLGFLTALPSDQVETVLLHELAHIIRSDYLVNLFQRLVEGLLFYHPAAWWMSSVIRTERENCCDDIVMQARGNAHAYAAALTELENNRHESWLPREPGIAANGGNLVKRIKRLLYPKAPNGLWAPITATILLMTTAGLALAAWKGNPQAAESAAKTQDSWQKWLNEDVAYIIADDERAAFERLKFNDEREHFVEQFWERRNPVPGSSENAFRKEHYRRLAFANDHFATSYLPGWRTDRGYMYIIFGPPDEIESHPADKWEVWKYHDASGQTFQFVDRTGDGDYRLGTPNHR